MFTAYFDASGDENSPVVTVAGFVSRVSKWERFEQQWRGLLPPDIALFHMTDFASSRKGWELWKEITDQRAHLMAQLTSCIKKNTNKGFAASVAKKDYDRVNLQYAISEDFGGRYVLCGMACLAELQRWATSQKQDYRRIRCVFEDGDDGQGRLLKLAETVGFNVIRQSKRLIRAFDACDLGAWKARRIVDAAFDKKMHRYDPAGFKRTLASLDELGPILQDNGILRTKAIEQVCVNSRVPVRLGTHEAAYGGNV